LATVLYIGYIPWIPGTFASVFGVGVALAAGENAVISAALIALLLLPGIRAASAFENTSGLKDDKRIVIDELVGMLIALWGIEVRMWTFLMSFLTFRMLDIWKPFPARRLERVSGGWGIMLDDVVVGIYTNLLVRLGMLIIKGI
jgi:phosphatidylglycerophosphatase A